MSSESADMSTADFEMAEKKRLAAERRKKLLDQVRHSEDLNTGPFEYCKHLNTELFEVPILNGLVFKWSD